MNKTIIAGIFVLLATACIANETSTEWTLTEPVDESVEERASEESCTLPTDGDWEAEDFPFVVYQFLACERDDTENIIFSPAAIEIALAEAANDLDGSDGQNLAEAMGFDSSQQFADHTSQYREDLLDRRPRDVRPDMTDRTQSSLDSYLIDEDDPETLLEALGIEFYTIDCDDRDSDSCRWSAQNGRWDESFLSHDDITAEPDDPYSNGFVLRGQWFLIPNYYDVTFDFDIDNDRTMTAPQLGLRTHAVGAVGDTKILVSQLIGEEIALITVSDPTKTLADLESSLSNSLIREWHDSLHMSPSSAGPHVLIPGLDIQDTVEITDFAGSPATVTSTTRFATDIEGINYPVPVERVIPPLEGDAIAAGPYIYPRVYRFDQPFLFIVYDYPTESILMMGRIADPS